MKYIRDYMVTLHELAIIDKYIYNIAMPISNKENRTILIDGVAHYVKPDGQVSLRPRSKFRYPTKAEFLSLIAHYDKDEKLLSNHVLSELDISASGLNMTLVSFLDIMDNLRDTACVNYHRHHGNMLEINALSLKLVDKLTATVRTMIGNLQVNTTTSPKSNFLNADITVSKYADLSVIFINKHDVYIYIYEDGDVIAVDMKNDVSIVNMANKLIRLSDIFAEFPADGIDYDFVVQPIPQLTYVA